MEEKNIFNSVNIGIKIKDNDLKSKPLKFVRNSNLNVNKYFN